MKKYFFATLTVVTMMALVGCSSDDDEIIEKNSQNVTLEDIKGTWRVTDASLSNIIGVELVLDDLAKCVWSDKFDNAFAGPYYFLENVTDEVLKEQCALIGSEINNKIHIMEIKVIGHLSGNADLYLNCDLMPLLPSISWQYFDEKVNRSAWYFWEDNWFKYTFEITEYTDSRMKLKLSSSLIRFDDYEHDYPLRIPTGTTLTMQRTKRQY